tara:strand:+ start:584 stop:1636 length:1053 start_codon:yes stop_codon:yes gene_type:complete
MRIILIGPFPKPTSGMSFINDSFFKKLKKRGKKIIKLDTTYKNHQKNLFNLLSKPFFMIKKFYNLIYYIKYKKSIVYISLSASFGKNFDLIFILIAKLFKCKLIIHHHSSKYIINYSFFIKLICFLINKSDLHICLTKKMRNEFCKNYNIKNSISLSNNFFLNEIKENKRIKKKLITIGFLGNIIQEKGIFIFLKILKKLASFNIKGIIGGPIIANKDYIKKKIYYTANLKYLGEVDNLKKENFFKKIDILLFPSKLTEAEPLVILECMARGIPVIAIDKGYIKEIINKNCGFVFSEKIYFKKTINILIKFAEKKLKLENFSRNCFFQSKHNNKLSQKKFQSLINYIDEN